MQHQTKVGVLRGGPSNEYEVSLKSGAAVLNVLNNHHFDTYIGKDIFIDRKGIWHKDGLPLRPEQAINSVDIVFNALHGAYGEDGKVQSLLEDLGKPFTGSGSLGSSIGMNKILAKGIFKTHGLKTPIFKSFSSENIIDNVEAVTAELFQTFHMPAIVKPVKSGSSVGVTLVKYYNELPNALLEAAKHDDTVMIEEFISGVEATCAVIDGFRGQELYALPPVEIRPVNSFFDYEAKYAGKSIEIVPATFSVELKKSIEESARNIHRALGLRHYSRSDFIVHPRRGIYVLEVNTLPGLTDESLLPKALRAIGSDTHELVGHLLSLCEN